MEKELHKAICKFIKNVHEGIMFTTDLSGIRLTAGQAVQAKKLRSSNGFPDIMIFEPRGEFKGLFIEVKTKTPFKLNGDIQKNDHLEEQFKVLQKLNNRGYYALFVWTLGSAKEIINQYLNIN